MLGAGITRRLVVWAAISSIITGEAAAACARFEPSLYVNENGTWRNNFNPGTVDVASTTDITIDKTNPIGTYFTVGKNVAGDKWELTYVEGLTTWYDTPETVGKTDVKLSFTYTCSTPSESYSYEHVVQIYGQNNKPPEFNQVSYEAEISKLTPPDVPLHFIDASFVITAEDRDFVNPNHPGGSDKDQSNNTVTACIVEGDAENAIKCEVKPEETDTSVVYRMWVSLTKHIDNIAGDSYSFQLKAQDGGVGDLVQTSESVTVTLKFPQDEDLKGPEFSQSVYTASKITSLPDQYPHPIDVPVSATDGDDIQGTKITYTVVSVSPTCDQCFQFTDSSLQMTKPLTQEMILSRLVTVVVQATEVTAAQRSSVTVVNIPIAGDDSNPHLDKTFYRASIVEDGGSWSLDTPIQFTATDGDTMIEDNLFSFTLEGGDFAVNDFFELSNAEIKLKADFDINNLPKDGKVAFFLEVIEQSDDRRSSRSLVTIDYPVLSGSTTSTTKTTTTTPGTTTACPTL